MLKNDLWINQKASEGMIKPFQSNLVRHLEPQNKQKPVLSYGCSSYGYDLRLSSKEFLIFRHIPGTVMNPKKFNPNCEILIFSERINPKNALELIKEFDVICDCSDNFGTRYLINDSCLILNKPLVFGSVQGFEGQVSVFNLYKNSPNLRDLLPESPSKNASPSCAEYGVVGVSTGLIGILQVNEIIKIILKKGEILDGKILIFDLLNMNMKKLHLKSDQLNKRIKNLSQFESFYDGYEYCEKNSEINSINANDFNSLYKAKPNKILLIDVRENEEFSTSAIKGSISIPLSHLNQESDLKFIQKESLSKEVFTICKSGKRSEKASRILSQFKIQSRSIEGGIEKVKKILCN